MNKQELIDRVALTANTTNVDARKAVDHVLAAIEHGVMRDGEVSVMGFGKFRRVRVAERVGRNPATGAPLVIPEKHTVRFKVGKGFADLANGERDGE